MVADITTIINQQLPLIIMSVMNGTDMMKMIPIILIPCVILLAQKLPVIIDYLFFNQIPRNYVGFSITDAQPGFGAVDHLSIFLNKFKPDSISNGSIKRFRNKTYEKLTSYRSLSAIINPNHDYFCKLTFGDTIGDTTILDKLISKKFFFPESIDLHQMRREVIYISLDKKSEQIVTGKPGENRIETIEKDFVRVSASNIKIAKDAIYIIMNYNMHKMNDVTKFKLKKFLFFHDETYNYNQVISEINVKKTYANVFLSKSNETDIINTINAWQKYKYDGLKRGIPNKLGFLLEGKPGCGKTSLIYAIAEETKKNIITIDLKNFTNNSFISMMSWITNKIVVFDDIDVNKFVHKRTNQNLKTKHQTKNEIKIDVKNLVKKKDKSKIEKKKMSLDVFLEVLDGYNYLNNCIVIMTTNHPEMIDPAVIRPGRVDKIIHFEYCDQYQFGKIFKYFIGKDYQEFDKNFEFEDNKYSTSYIINNIIIPNRANPLGILQELDNDY